MMILFYTKHYKYVEYNETIFLLMKCNFEKFEIENNFNITFVFFFKYNFLRVKAKF